MESCDWLSAHSLMCERAKPVWWWCSICCDCSGSKFSLYSGSCLLCVWRFCLFACGCVCLFDISNNPFSFRRLWDMKTQIEVVCVACRLCIGMFAHALHLNDNLRIVWVCGFLSVLIWFCVYLWTKSIKQFCRDVYTTNMAMATLPNFFQIEILTLSGIYKSNPNFMYNHIINNNEVTSRESHMKISGRIKKPFLFTDTIISNVLQFFQPFHNACVKKNPYMF